MSVRENIKKIIRITAEIDEINTKIQDTLNNSKSINIDDHRLASNLLSLQNIEIEKLRYFMDEAIENLMGKGKYLQFIAENTND